MNEDYLTAEFKKLGLTKFVTCIEKLANAWFGGVNSDEDTVTFKAALTKVGFTVTVR